MLCSLVRCWHASRRPGSFYVTEKKKAHDDCTQCCAMGTMLSCRVLAAAAASDMQKQQAENAANMRCKDRLLACSVPYKAVRHSHPHTPVLHALQKEQEPRIRTTGCTQRNNTPSKCAHLQLATVQSTCTGAHTRQCHGSTTGTLYPVPGGILWMAALSVTAVVTRTLQRQMPAA
jgi:hypothetical protein